MLARYTCTTMLLQKATTIGLERYAPTLKRAHITARYATSLRSAGKLLEATTTTTARTQWNFQRSFHAKSLSTVRFMWKRLFGKYLLLTNVISSGILMVVGDACAQEIEYARHHKPQPDGRPFDYTRFGRMFVVGALQGPMHHYMYNWMDAQWPAVTPRNITFKILMDQLIMAPICILLFFYPACYMEHKTLSETNAELMMKFPVIYVMDWMVWPVVQYVNFRYLDLKYRVMFVNICTAVYNIFMSYMKHEFKNIHEL